MPMRPANPQPHRRAGMAGMAGTASAAGSAGKRVARAFAGVALLVLVMAATGGCVQRKLTFRTNVPDADVRIELDGEAIGDAPASVYFVRYGKREFTARADGYQTVSGTIDLTVPWYQYFPFDFFAEVLYPGTIEDRHEVDIEMVPATPGTPADLHSRAEQERRRARDVIKGRTQEADDQAAEEGERRR